MRNFITIHSSHGELYADKVSGEALAYSRDGCEECENFAQITYFDLEEWKTYWGVVKVPDSLDILDVGYTITIPGQGQIMEPPAMDWRRDMKEMRAERGVDNSHEHTI